MNQVEKIMNAELDELIEIEHSIYADVSFDKTRDHKGVWYSWTASPVSQRWRKIFPMRTSQYVKVFKTLKGAKRNFIRACRNFGRWEENVEFDYSGLPAMLRRGLRDYIEHGIIPGGFLVSVLENNLEVAVTLADPTNMERLPDIILWLLKYMPRTAWGSAEAVRAWKEAKFAERYPGEVNNGGT